PTGPHPPPCGEGWGGGRFASRARAQRHCGGGPPTASRSGVQFDRGVSVNRRLLKSELLRDIRDLRVGEKAGVVLVVPIEDRPDPLRVVGIDVVAGTPASVRPTLVGTRGSEVLQNPIEVGHAGDSDDHDRCSASATAISWVSLTAYG